MRQGEGDAARAAGAASIDLTTLTGPELALLAKLVENGRLRATVDAVVFADDLADEPHLTHQSVI